MARPRQIRSPDAAPEDVDELVGLAALDDGLRGHQRDRDIEPDIDDHRPEQGMRDRIEAGQTEQLVGAQQGNTERTVVHEALSDPAGAGEGRQQQRVDPNQEAAGEPGERSRLGRSGPQNAPTIAGANCAAATNETSPMVTRA